MKSGPEQDKDELARRIAALPRAPGGEYKAFPLYSPQDLPALLKRFKHLEWLSQNAVMAEVTALVGVMQEGGVSVLEWCDAVLLAQLDHFVRSALAREHAMGIGALDRAALHAALDATCDYVEEVCEKDGTTQRMHATRAAYEPQTKQ